ncbi:MAG: DUF6268 family outer membrane beta-barrel protein [Flavobacteriaceae bacterium]|nr:DUF6268 family outer membrane beta-barrel protein [Flavobacteriaceae bacterium]
MIRNFFVIFFVLLSLISFSQIKDIGGVDYTSMINGSSDADFSRSRVWIAIPLKLKKENHVIVSGISYANIHLDFNTLFDFDVSPLSTIHSLEYTLGYTFLLKNKDWRFTAQLSPTLSSNLESGVKFDDLLWSGGILFIKTKNEPKKSRLTLGLVYSQRAGIPAPIPFATYFKQVNNNFTYTIGVPISKMKYYFNKRTSLESFVTFDGYYANLSNPIQVNDKTAEHISMSAIITGLGFDKYYGKRFNAFIKFGYTLNNSLKLVENRRDDIYDFDMDKTFTFRGGFKFNF